MPDSEIERRLWNKADKFTVILLLGFVVFWIVLFAIRLRRLEDRIFTLEREFPPAIDFTENDDERRN